MGRALGQIGSKLGRESARFGQFWADVGPNSTKLGRVRRGSDQICTDVGQIGGPKSTTCSAASAEHGQHLPGLDPVRATPGPAERDVLRSSYRATQGRGLLLCLKLRLFFRLRGLGSRRPWPDSPKFGPSQTMFGQLCSDSTDVWTRPVRCQPTFGRVHAAVARAFSTLAWSRHSSAEFTWNSVDVNPDRPNLAQIGSNWTRALSHSTRS